MEVWDENWDVIHLYKRYSRQWRMAMNGPVALDMNVFHHELTRKKVPDDEYDEMIAKLNVIESEALKWINRP